MHEHILFVSGLGDEVEEESLDIFKAFGPASIDLIRAAAHDLLRPAHHELGGCAYISYTHRSHAESAIRIMHGIKMEGSRIRVSWSVADHVFRQNSPSIFKKKQNSILFVSGLAVGVDEDYLEIFKVFGQSSVNLLRAATHQLTGCSYIHYLNRSDAESAIKIMDGIMMEGRRITVRWSFADPIFRQRSTSVLKRPVESSHSFQEYGILFVSGLGVRVNEESLNIFKVFGSASVNLLPPATHQGLGRAYITYSNRSDAESSMKILHGIMMDGRQIKVNWSLGDPIIRQSSGFIFIKNLMPWSSKEDTERQLIEAFQNYGRVLYCRVPVQEHGWNRGFGIVQMGGNCEARRAVSALHDTVLNHHFGCKLYVINASAVFLALSKHSETSDNLVSDGPGECFVCCRACSTRVSVCNYMQACMECSKKYSCPICDPEYHPQ